MKFCFFFKEKYGNFEEEVFSNFSYFAKESNGISQLIGGKEEEKRKRRRTFNRINCRRMQISRKVGVDSNLLHTQNWLGGGKRKRRIIKPDQTRFHFIMHSLTENVVVVEVGEGRRRREASFPLFF